VAFLFFFKYLYITLSGVMDYYTVSQKMSQVWLADSFNRHRKPSEQMSNFWTVQFLKTKLERIFQFSAHPTVGEFLSHLLANMSVNQDAY